MSNRNFIDYFSQTLKKISLLLIIGFAVIGLAKADFNLDVDDDGKTEGLTHGLSVIHYFFGFSDDAQVAGAISSNASRRLADRGPGQIRFGL